MPSLRRTLSSPSVRSSPYPASLSNASNGLAAGRSQGHGQRRASGTEISGRRVLADIEWWRVADGQRDIDTAPEPEEHDDHDQGQEQGQVVDELSGGAGIPSSDLGAERPSTPFAGTSYDAGSHETSPMLPTTQFAALSITPHTPIRRRHTLESSSSSLESTPEATETPLEPLRLGLADLAFGLTHDAPPALPTTMRGRAKPLLPILAVRTHSFTDFSLHDDIASRYADFAVSPFSSHSPDLFN